MSVHAVGPIKRYWQTRAGMTELPAEEVTHRDVWQRWLEIETIRQFVRATDRALDVGCGNGFTTNRIAQSVREIVGVDYSEEMIRRAVTENDRNGAERHSKVTFKVRDVLELDPADLGLFDAVISERCLINLGSWADQKRAIAKIASVLKPGGRFIFLEGSKQGRQQLNAFRSRAGLAAMPRVWHNIDFDEPATLAYLRRSFSLDQRVHFGLYDFVSRVAHPLIIAPDRPQYDSRINEVAAKLALGANEFGSISRVVGLVLRKKARSHLSRKGGRG
ncbi:MAG TPA: class I SAM-dependent methyltransferase [Methylomirabilota bacterium]|nr:class I SAM-dependent methyltransferase [Methylomirabilota bacterium]